jgi:cellulose synthase/poly-beta-1,6-N-acetylglucosamine synthase-like glycosyltransferase
LKENLEALLIQDYPEYEVIFVVDDPDDAAIPVIREVSPDANIVAAGKAAKSGQKVENLRESVLHAAPASTVLVFADSDARPSRDWLRHLVAPLQDDNVGVATGYRWFISTRPGLASELRSVWNASIASSLGPGLNNQFCWGGSTAIRRETFERLDIRGKWYGTVSDDFVLARAVRDAGRVIYFVPQALTASVDDCTLRELVEFTTRQIKLTRVYAPRLWKMLFFSSGLFSVVMLSAVPLAIFSGNGVAVGAAIFTFITVSVLSIGKAWLRLKAVRLVMKEYEKELRGQAVPQLTLWLLTPLLFFYNSAAALFSRRIKWRGTSYLLVSATETRVLQRGRDAR